jgi:hypothetical protein
MIEGRDRGSALAFVVSSVDPSAGSVGFPAKRIELSTQSGATSVTSETSNAVQTRKPS